MNGPKLQLDLMTQLLLLPTYWLPHSNQVSSAVRVFEDTSSSDALATPIVSY
jgi:hypothetical protein